MTTKAMVSRCWGWTKPVVFVLAGWLLCRSMIADVSEVSGSSMEPALVNGNWVVVNRLAYGLHVPGTKGYLLMWNEPARGDIIIFYDPVTGRLLVKRVLGLPGDRIDVHGGYLCINGKPLTPQPLAGQEPMTVPAGRVFVMGDNRPHSRDSRSFGPVAEQRIIGRVVGMN
jgi:signal peptidase I